MDTEVSKITEDQQRKREKLGLVVFVLAILTIFAAVGAYMFAGHNFDLAASGIDSQVGQLNGYASIVFEGTNSPLLQSEKTEFQELLEKSFEFMKSEDQDSSSSAKSSDQSDASVNFVPATTKNVSEIYKDKGSTVFTIDTDDANPYPNGEIIERDNWKIGVLSIDEPTLNAVLQSKALQIAKEESESKNTHQDSSESIKHTEGNDKSSDNVSSFNNDNSCLSTNDQSSVDNLKDNQPSNSQSNSPTSKNVKTKTPEMIALQKKISTLRYDNGADLVIILAPSQDVLDVCERVDCVIAKNVRDQIPVEGKLIGSTYLMRLPSVGSVGTLLSTPAKMLSAMIYSRVQDKQNTQ